MLSDSTEWSDVPSIIFDALIAVQNSLEESKMSLDALKKDFHDENNALIAVIEKLDDSATKRYRMSEKRFDGKIKKLAMTINTMLEKNSDGKQEEPKKEKQAASRRLDELSSKIRELQEYTQRTHKTEYSDLSSTMQSVISDIALLRRQIKEQDSFFSNKLATQSEALIQCQLKVDALQVALSDARKTLDQQQSRVNSFLSRSDSNKAETKSNFNPPSTQLLDSKVEGELILNGIKLLEKTTTENMSNILHRITLVEQSLRSIDAQSQLQTNVMSLEPKIHSSSGLIGVSDPNTVGKCPTNTQHLTAGESYSREYIDERLQNMWMSFISLLARKKDAS